MAFKIVQCEVRWVVYVGSSGNELPPTNYSCMGEFENEELATQALITAGFTSRGFGF